MDVDDRRHAHRGFATTQWSRVIAAGDRQDPHYQAALSELCEKYWFPAYAFIRRSTVDESRAQDLTQGFFLSLLERDIIGRADPQRGRFRTYLLVALKGYLANQVRHDQAVKRGGQHRFVSLDFSTGEDRLKIEPSVERTAEDEFDRRWAIELLDRSLARLEGEYGERGRADLFAELKPALVGEEAATAMSVIANKLGMSENSIRVAAHRMRKRYSELVRLEVAETVNDESEVESELAKLLDAVTDSGGQS